MKDAEDEAFDDLAKRQGDWGSGFQAKRQMAADKFCDAHCVWTDHHPDCKMAADKLQEPPSEWAGIKAILDEYGLQAIDFVADFKAALAQPAQEPVAYAGIQIWVGDARIVKHFTEMELHHARDHWMLMQIAAELCLAKLKEKNT
jgi:hypothetical protein